MNLINTAFGNYTDTAFENKAQNILLQQKNKTLFPSSFPELDALEAAVKAFSDALAGALDGGRILTAKKNAARKALQMMLLKVAGFVAMVAGDDVTIILAAGFDARKPREPRPAITTPENLMVESGANSGEVIVSVDAVNYVKMYHFEYTTDPLSETSVWITETDTRSSHRIVGLKAGQKYWFRVTAIGVRGRMVCSVVTPAYVK